MKFSVNQYFMTLNGDEFCPQCVLTMVLSNKVVRMHKFTRTCKNPRFVPDGKDHYLFDSELVKFCTPISQQVQKIEQEILDALALVPKIFVTQCECGATKCGSPSHSNWCPKHEV